MLQQNEFVTPLKKSRAVVYLPLLVLSLSALFFLFLHLGIIFLPMACFLLGLVLRNILAKHFLIAFAFLFPVLSAVAGLDNHGLPFNYLLLPLTLLAGIYAGEWFLSKKKALDLLSAIPRSYLLFLMLLLLSSIFVFCRWSNLTIPGLAFFSDTQVDPNNTRLSFAVIFPILEIALYVISVLFFLYLQRNDEKRAIILGFLAGHSLSILVALWQSLHLKKLIPGLGHGLASDSTFYGFLTAIAFLLSWYLYYRYQERVLGAVFFIVSFIGLLTSKTRIGFLALIAVGVLFFFFEKKNRKWGIILFSFLLAMFLFRSLYMKQGDFVAIDRIKYSFNFIKKVLLEKKVDAKDLEGFSAHRQLLWAYSFSACKQYPLTGIGVGNFLFWTRYNFFNKNVFHDLPASQFLFIAVSSGLLGLAVFLIFCWQLIRQRPTQDRWLLGLVLLILFLGNYLWAPEAILAFWLVASLGFQESETARAKKRNIWPAMTVLVVFVIANLFSFIPLHPKTWARDTSTPYDYGFSYQETDSGRPFRWTGAKAGIYIYLDQNGRNSEYKLFCGAPLSFLDNREQEVAIYWRGKLFKKVKFRKNIEYPLQIEDHEHSEGFLEFRIRPAFNLKRMGLGAETRDLGIQLFGGEK